MKIYSVSDPEFRAYGKVLEGYDTGELVQAMDELDEQSNAGYADRFLSCYVEYATLQESSLMRTAGWVLLLGGVILFCVGIGGIVLFRDPVEEENADAAS